MHRLLDDWRFTTRAELAGDDMLEHVCGVAKARPSKAVLTRGGFDDVVRKLIGKLARVTGPEDTKALRAAAKKLDRRWDTMSAAARTRVIKSAADGLRAIPKVIVPTVAQILKGDLGAVVEATKGATAAAHGYAIGADLNTQDRRIVDFAASSQGSYITDQYGQRATAYEQRARDIVADGLDKGLGRNDISERLSAELTDPMLGRSAVYWDQVASIHVARARSYAQIASYDEAGVERYQIDEAMDEVTCVICRLMNGKTFDVGGTLDRYKEIEESGDPYAVVTKQPFIRVGKTEDGDRFLYADGAGGKTHFVAEVLEDATGERDERGSYGRQASEEKLQAVGCAQPPFHGRCRGLTVPG